MDKATEEARRAANDMVQAPAQLNNPWQKLLLFPSRSEQIERRKYLKNQSWTQAPNARRHDKVWT